MELNSNGTPTISEIIDKMLESDEAQKSSGTVVKSKFKPNPGFHAKWKADIEKNKKYRNYDFQAVCTIINDFV